MKKIMNFCKLFLALLSFVSLSLQAETIKDYTWDKLDTTVPAIPLDTSFNFVILKEHTAYEVALDPKANEPACYRMLHKKIKILKTSGLEATNKVYLPVYEEKQVIDIKARCVNPDGKVIELDRSQVKTIENLENQGKYIIFAIDGAEVGSIIEYYYVVADRFKSHSTITIQDNVPMYDVSCKVIMPLHVKLLTKSYNGFTNMEEKLDSTSLTRSYTATSTFVPADPDEKHSLGSSYLQRVEWCITQIGNSSRVNSFNSTASNYTKTCFTQDKKELAVLKKMYKAIGVLDTDDDETKIRKIETYYKVNYSIVEEQFEGVSDIPSIYKNKFSSPFGATRVLSGLLKMANVKFEIVLTSEKNKKIFDPEFDGLNFMDDVILYFPSIDKYLYPGDVIYRLGFVPEILYDQDGLYLKETSFSGVTSVIPRVAFIKPVAYDQNVDTMNIVANLDLDALTLKLNVRRSFTGEAAMYPQGLYHRLDADKQEAILKTFSHLEESDNKFENFKVYNFAPTDLLVKPFIFTVDILAPSYLSRAGANVLLEIGNFIGPQAQLYQEKDRKTPVYSYHAHQYVRKLVVPIPVGYTIQNPEVLNFDVKMMKNNAVDACFVSKYKIEDGKLIVEIVEFYKSVSLPAEMFNDYKNVINAAADFNKKVLIIKKI